MEHYLKVCGKRFSKLLSSQQVQAEADESVGEGNSAEDSQEGEEWTIEHITWKLDAEKSSLPEFDSSEESAGAVYKSRAGKPTVLTVG